MGAILIGFTQRSSPNPPKKRRQKARSLACLGLLARDSSLREESISPYVAQLFQTSVWILRSLLSKSCCPDPRLLQEVGDLNPAEDK
ncbi:hypothetical protein [Nostoc sp.]